MGERVSGGEQRPSNTITPILIFPRQRLCRNVADYPVVIPSEREGSRFLAALEMTRVVKRNGISAIATQSLKGEGGFMFASLTSHQEMFSTIPNEL